LGVESGGNTEHLYSNLLVVKSAELFSHSQKEKSMQGQKGRGRGFASMSPEKKREIASKGGKAAHALGTAHKWTSEEAQAAGRKGGSISRRRSKYNVQA
jgi:general stress protein YciG